ncbi:MAG: DUF4031 domain-containing protein [bacterium]|nr:MAG: DUF4031 domain-containing protein [bacterium]
MAVYMDRPNGDGWAHLISNLEGNGGRRELVRFGRMIGLTRRIHRMGCYGEHYDIRGSEIRRAAAAGALLVARREIALILRGKRRSLEGAAASTSCWAPKTAPPAP